MSEVFRFLSMALMLFNICNQNDMNRKACVSDWDQWLYPELHRAWELKTGQETPYQEETDKLK